MSFALEYRKKNFTALKVAPLRRQPKRKVVQREIKQAAACDTGRSRAAALGALLMAALILAIFNSEGMRIAAGDLAEHDAGRPVLAVSEVWDDAMDRAGAKTLVTRVRGYVADVREASWADVAELVGVPAYAGKGGGKAIAIKPRLNDQAGVVPDHTGSIKRPSKHAIDADD